MTEGLRGEDELGRLLAPVTRQAFVERYWGREPLYVRGPPEKFAGLFDRESFDRLREGPWGPPEVPPVVKLGGRAPIYFTR